MENKIDETAYINYFKKYIDAYKDTFDDSDFIYLKSKESIFTTLQERLIGVFNNFKIESFHKEMEKINPLFIVDPKLVSENEFLEAKKNTFSNLNWIPSKLVDITIKNFDNFIHVFNRDFIKNKANIEKTLFDKAEIKEILNISALSTTGYNQGRFTLIVKTNAGDFVYKKHSCQNDVWFYDFINRYFKGYIYTPKCYADNDSCGFCEYIIEQIPSENDYQLYCRNLGIVASLTCGLGLSDLHVNNVLVNGVVPVIIDNEILFRPFTTNTVNELLYGKNLDAGYTYYLNRSVLGHIIVGSFYSPLTKIPQEVFDNKMKEIFIQGFSFGYDIFLENKDEILKEIDKAYNNQVRYVLRKIDYYRMWTYKLYSDSSKEYVNRISNKTFPNQSLICEYELSFLMQGNTPYFYTYMFSKDLYGIDEKILIKDFFEKSPLDMTYERIKLMSLNNKEFEITLIKKSFEHSSNKKIEEDNAFIKHWEDRMVCAPNMEYFFMDVDAENMILSFDAKDGSLGIAKRCIEIIDSTSDGSLKQRAQKMVQICLSNFKSTINDNLSFINTSKLKEGYDVIKLIHEKDPSELSTKLLEILNVYYNH